MAVLTCIKPALPHFHMCNDWVATRFHPENEGDDDDDDDDDGGIDLAPAAWWICHYELLQRMRNLTLELVWWMHAGLYIYVAYHLQYLYIKCVCFAYPISLETCRGDNKIH